MLMIVGTARLGISLETGVSTIFLKRSSWVIILLIAFFSPFSLVPCKLFPSRHAVSAASQICFCPAVFSAAFLSADFLTCVHSRLPCSPTVFSPFGRPFSHFFYFLAARQAIPPIFSLSRRPAGRLRLPFKSRPVTAHLTLPSVLHAPVPWLASGA